MCLLHALRAVLVMQSHHILSNVDILEISGGIYHLELASNVEADYAVCALSVYKSLKDLIRHLILFNWSQIFF